MDLVVRDDDRLVERERCKTNDLVRVDAGVVLRALTLLSRARRVRDP